MKQIILILIVFVFNSLLSIDLVYKNYLIADSTYSVNFKALAINVTSDYGMRKLDTSK